MVLIIEVNIKGINFHFKYQGAFKILTGQ